MKRLKLKAGSPAVDRFFGRLLPCEELVGTLSASEATQLFAWIAADLVHEAEPGRFVLTDLGKARLRREAAAATPGALDPFRAQHLAATAVVADQGDGRTLVQINEAESPLLWLARRKGKDGRPLVAPHQFLAGERLRAEFTRGQMTPRVTADWSSSASGRGGGGRGAATVVDAVLAARQRLQSALTAVGPEFAGLLLDVCCFLKRLEEVEQERRWPVRSAKVVLGLALDRLARHYGFSPSAQGPERAAMQAWAAAGEAPVVAEEPVG